MKELEWIIRWGETLVGGISAGLIVVLCFYTFEGKITLTKIFIGFGSIAFFIISSIFAFKLFDKIKKRKY